MNARNHISGQCLVPGHASGEVLYTDVPLSFWMGVDTVTGIVIDKHHPLCGQSVTGKIFALPGGRGSCAGSCGLLELIVSGAAPAALVFEQNEAILTLGAVIADEIFGKTIPIVSVGSEAFGKIRAFKSATVSNGSVDEGANAASVEPKVYRRPAGIVNLTESDQARLAGAEGKARQAAMRIITRFAEIQDVTHLVNVEQVHIDCSFYTGPGGLAFAERLREWGGKVVVPATTNSNSVDLARWREQGADAGLADASRRIAQAYVGMGAKPSFTCAPYLLESAPAAGQQVAWGESNAVVFANSVLGARTMKYPDYLDLCVALTGRAPLLSSHAETGRRATVLVDISAIRAFDDAFYPLLGYHIGQLVGYEIPVVTGHDWAAPSRDDLKAFSAAFATTSAAPLFHMVGVTPEAATLDDATGGIDPTRRIVLGCEDLRASWQELNTAKSERVDTVALGNPHFSYTEIEKTAELFARREGRIAVRTVVTCGREVYAKAENAGLVDRLRQSGLDFLTDTCWCMITEPMLPGEVRTIATNSAKLAHYGPGVAGRAFHFASLENCVDAAITGCLAVAMPDWLLGKAPPVDAAPRNNVTE